VGETLMRAGDVHATAAELLHLPPAEES